MNPGDSREPLVLLERIRSGLNAGRADQEIKAIRRFSHPEAVNDCTASFEINKDRMRCDLCRSRGIQIGSGGVEGAPPDGGLSGETDGQPQDCEGGECRAGQQNAALRICAGRMSWIGRLGRPRRYEPANPDCTQPCMCVTFGSNSESCNLDWIGTGSGRDQRARPVTTIPAGGNGRRCLPRYVPGVVA